VSRSKLADALKRAREKAGQQPASDPLHNVLNIAAGATIGAFVDEIASTRESGAASLVAGVVGFAIGAAGDDPTLKAMGAGALAQFAAKAGAQAAQAARTPPLVEEATLAAQELAAQEPKDK